ncbi:MAG: T9SS type A sorting domain-containing protein [Bacteroidia bacterium]|nr:T9SS type A sorting domain-containing protein [Bacteroidia bacterium]
MKKGLITALFILSGLFHSFSQCTPDPTITDPENDGTLFPDTLIFKQNRWVNLILTITPPPTATYQSQVFILSKIVIRNITNIPAGLSYVSNANIVQTGYQYPTTGYELVVGQRYCMLLSGTPTGSFIGTDSMAVMVDAYIAGPLLLAENENGGYVNYTVCAQTDSACVPTDGEIPAELKFKQNKPLNNMKLSIAPPSQADYQGSTYNLYKMVLRNISNKPAWLTYTTNASQVTTGTQNPVQGDEFIIGQKYTMTLNGTPDSSFSGTDTMDFVVDLYRGTASQTVLLAENSYSIKMPYTVCLQSDTGCHTTGIQINEFAGFFLPESNPSVFGNTTKIRILSDKTKKIELCLYNMIGQLIYKEILNAETGENYFNFTGESLHAEPYIYTVSDYKNKFSKKLVKTE